MADRPTWQAFLALDDAALLAQCSVDRFRASGPGGQKRNVTDSAVRLRHAPSGLTGEAVESRSQHENRARALRRLRGAIALHLRVPVDLEGYEPPEALAEALSRGALNPLGRRSVRRLEAMAQLCDVLEAAGWRVADAARARGVSSAAVGRLLADDEALWRAAAERRRALGLPPLRR